MDEPRIIWTADKPRVDFMPLLVGETTDTTLTFITKNASIYIVNAAEHWWQRETNVSFNTWALDGQHRPLVEVLGATACGITLQYGDSPSEVASTTPIAMVIAGNLLNNPEFEIEIGDTPAPSGHPQRPCSAHYCAAR